MYFQGLLQTLLIYPVWKYVEVIVMFLKLFLLVTVPNTDYSLCFATILNSFLNVLEFNRETLLFLFSLSSI